MKKNILKDVKQDFMTTKTGSTVDTVKVFNTIKEILVAGSTIDEITQQVILDLFSSGEIRLAKDVDDDNYKMIVSNVLMFEFARCLVLILDIREWLGECYSNDCSSNLISDTLNNDLAWELYQDSIDDYYADVEYCRETAPEIIRSYTVDEFGNEKDVTVY